MTGEKLFTIQNQDAGFCFIWGLYAAVFTPDLFQRVPNLYVPMLSLAPQFFWGCLFMACGLSAWTLSYFGRRWVASLLLGAVYTLFAMMYYDGDIHSPGGSLYLWLGLFNVAFLLVGLVFSAAEGKWHKQTP